MDSLSSAPRTKKKTGGNRQLCEPPIIPRLDLSLSEVVCRGGMQCGGNGLDPLPSSSDRTGVRGMLRWYLTHDPSSTMGPSSPSPLNEQPETEQQRAAGPAGVDWTGPSLLSRHGETQQTRCRLDQCAISPGATVRCVYSLHHQSLSPRLPIGKGRLTIARSRRYEQHCPLKA